MYCESNISELKLIILMGYLCEIKVLTRRKNIIKKTNMIQKTYFKTKDYCKVKFVVNHENAETIEILGLNSDWENSIVMRKKKDGAFTCDVSLKKDLRHEFKYLVNDTEWLNEAEADALHPNEFGGENSILIL